MLLHHARIRALGLAAVLAGTVGVAAAPAFATGEESESYVNDAKALLQKGDLKGAEIQLRNAVRANPEDAKTHIELGEVYLRLGNYVAAEAEARQAQENNGSDGDVAPLLAQALLRQNKIPQLLQQIQPANREAKRESIVRLVLGLAHLSLKERKEAEPLLRDAVRYDPEAWRPHLALAQLAMIDGKVAAAKPELDAAAAIAPENPEIQRFQGEYLRTTGDAAGALAVFDKLLAANPDDVAIRISRANILISQSKMADAQQDVD